MEESMSLKKIALIALIVMMLVSSVVFFGCKAKVQEETTETISVDTVEVVDTLIEATTTTTETETTTP
jgi:hypothetical protein